MVADFNGDVRSLIGTSNVAVLRIRGENMAKNQPSIIDEYICTFSFDN